MMPIRLARVSSPISLGERCGLFYGAADTEPSFGLVCVGAVAKDAGADVAIVEAFSRNLSLERTQNEILILEPDLVGMTSTTAGIVTTFYEGQAREKVSNFLGGSIR